ncbi:MAG: DUF4861 domain-containing protein [Chitinivibrionales bacterium]|nr:DUF4861 domain-containing protein [Chitinivibrionales bacterium]
MRTVALTLATVLAATGVKAAPNLTDVSLAFSADKVQTRTISASDGNLYGDLLHHGPAVEGPELALRMYFRDAQGIDIYSKREPGLILPTWYGGTGQDEYKVGTTCGLGSIRFWNGTAAVPVGPVSMRTATVIRDDSSRTSRIEMLSEGVMFDSAARDLLLTLTMYSDRREGMLEARLVKGGPLPLVSGLVVQPGNSVDEGEGWVLTWGRHTGAAVGAAVIYRVADVEKVVSRDGQMLVVAHPAERFAVWLTSGWANETMGLNTLNSFRAAVRALAHTVNENTSIDDRSSRVPSLRLPRENEAVYTLNGRRMPLPRNGDAGNIMGLTPGQPTAGRRVLQKGR